MRVPHGLCVLCGDWWSGTPPGGRYAQNEAAEIKLWAERRAGELLLEIEKNKGGGDHRLHDVTGAPKLRELGIEKIQSHRWQRTAIISLTGSGAF